MPELTKEQLYIILGVICVILIGCIIGVYNQNVAQKQLSPSSSPASAVAPLLASAGKPAQIYVHISGAVVREGLYKLNKGDRLIDLLKLSGVAGNADLDSVNLAEVLSDSQRVFIPKRALAAAQDTRISSPSSKKTEKKSSIVNINRANEQEMDSLPGIGPAMAKRIVDYRKEKGMFSSIDELKEVPGISEKKFEKLKTCISVY